MVEDEKSSVCRPSRFIKRTKTKTKIKIKMKIKKKKMKLEKIETKRLSGGRLWNSK